MILRMTIILLECGMRIMWNKLCSRFININVS